jgi:hypothetical protein
MSWDDLQMLVAVNCADDIAAVAREGGEALLRERLAALSGDQRKLVSEMLADLAA